MVPVPTYQNVPTFGTGATLVQPIAGTYNGGFLPGQLFPAEYQNWLMNGLSANGNTSETSVLSVTAELVNILTAAGITPAPATNTQVKSALDVLYAPYSEIASRQAADALLAPLAGATFTGPVIMNSTLSVQAATLSAQPYQKSQTDAAIAVETARAQAAEALLAPKANPTFTGKQILTNAIFGGSVSLLVSSTLTTGGIYLIPAGLKYVVIYGGGSGVIEIFDSGGSSWDLFAVSTGNATVFSDGLNFRIRCTASTLSYNVFQIT